MARGACTVTDRAEGHLARDSATLRAQSNTPWVDTALGHQHLPLAGLTYPHGAHLTIFSGACLPKPPLPLSAQTPTLPLEMAHQYSVVEFRNTGWQLTDSKQRQYREPRPAVASVKPVGTSREATDARALGICTRWAARLYEPAGFYKCSVCCLPESQCQSDCRERDSPYKG